MVRIGSYKVAPESTFSARKAQTKHVLAKADRELVEFLCFPEGFLTGYYAEEELALENCLEVSSVIFLGMA
jgi:predicted amidohydrolase